MVSVVGAVVRGGFDLVETKLIIERAYKWFFDGEFAEETKEEVVYEVSEDNNSVKVFKNVLKNIKDIKVKNPFKKDK